MARLARILMPRPGFFRRMSVYLGEMFPLPQRAASSMLLGIAFQIALARVNHAEFTPWSRLSWSSAVSVFLLLLVLRLMDELKDREIDSELFPDRPLPSGRVQEGDIRIALVVVAAGYLSVNSWSWLTLASSGGVLAYALLMFRFFFIPGVLRRYLLLNLATHNPIVPVMFLHQTVLMTTAHNWKWSQLEWPASLLLVAAFWGPFLAWEIARKIRAPEEENEYVTYSQLLGRVGAVLVAFGIQTLTLMALFRFFAGFGYSWSAVAVLCTGYSMLLAAYAHFLLRPSSVSSRLKGPAETYILFICVSVILGWVTSANRWGFQ